MKTVTLSRKELYDQVWSSPFSALEKQYYIYAEGLRKICKKMNIPIPLNGHWSRLKFKKEVEIIALPEDNSVQNEITLRLRTKEDPASGSYSPLSPIEKDIIEKAGRMLIVPGKLKDPHKLIIEAQNCLTGKDAYHSHENLIHTRSYQLDIRVSSKNIGRALRFMDTFIKIAESRGHRMCNDRKFSLVYIDGEEFRIKFREIVKKVENPKHWLGYDFVPTGVVTFNAFFINKGYEWKDGTTPLENKISSILAFMERKRFELKERQDEFQKHFDECMRIEQEARDKENLKKEELSAFIDLLNESKRWKESEDLRHYINLTEKQAMENNVLTDDLEEWIIWARAKANWYDPQTSADDALLYGCDKDSLEFN